MECARQRNGAKEPGKRGDNVERGQIAKPHAPVEQSRRLRSKRPQYDQGRERLGEAHSPRVAIKPAHDRSAEDKRDREAHAHGDVKPEQSRVLRPCDLRALHRCMTEAKILEEQGQPVERRDHRQEPEVGGHEQTRQDDHGAELHDHLNCLREAGEKKSLHGPLSEPVRHSIVSGIAHLALGYSPGRTRSPVTTRLGGCIAAE